MPRTAPSAVRLTRRAIDAIATPTDRPRIEIPDADLPGLVLRVTREGVRTWAFRGRVRGGGPIERVTLGRYPALVPDEARARAMELAARLARGESIAAEGRRARAEPTVEQAWQAFRTSKARRSQADQDRLYALRIAPKWGSRRLRDVSHAEVARWFLNLPAAIQRERAAVARAREQALAAHAAGGPAPAPLTPAQKTSAVSGTRTANLALGLLSAIYTHAIERERSFDGPNPATGHRRFTEEARDRFLGGDEIKAFFNALNEEPSRDWRDWLSLALLTGQRRSNLLAMKWSAVDLGAATWTIEAAETKNSRRHRVPLVPAAVAVLERRRADAAAHAAAHPDPDPAEQLRRSFVFPGSGASGHLAEPRGALERVLRRAGLSGVRVHDLRRTLGSWQAAQGASLVVVGRTLGQTTPAATAIYARLDLDPVRKSLEQATSAMLDAGGVAGAEVVDLGAKRKREA